MFKSLDQLHADERWACRVCEDAVLVWMAVVGHQLRHLKGLSLQPLGHDQPGGLGPAVMGIVPLALVCMVRCVPATSCSLVNLQDADTYVQGPGPGCNQQLPLLACILEAWVLLH